MEQLKSKQNLREVEWALGGRASWLLRCSGIPEHTGSRSSPGPTLAQTGEHVVLFPELKEPSKGRSERKEKREGGEREGAEAQRS